MSVDLPRHSLLQLYERLIESYGPQSWWPADSPFEVMVGAVLTQNTAWTNVERAIANLKQADALSLQTLNSLDHEALADLIRPSGYFNIKARRLQNLCIWLVQQGGVESLSNLSTVALREALLAVNGVGPETADDILLYAYERPVFVIDAYTRRLLSSLGLIQGQEPYEALRMGFEQALQSDHQFYNEYHALIVRHAKEKCSTENGCRHCHVQAPLP